MEANSLWPALKMYLGMGATGATAVLFAILWVRKDFETKKLNESRINSERDHSKELMKMQTDHSREMIGLIKQYDQQVSSVNKTLDELVSRED